MFKKMYRVIEIENGCSKMAIIYSKKEFTKLVNDIKQENKYDNIQMFKDGAVAWN